MGLVKRGTPGGRSLEKGRASKRRWVVGLKVWGKQDPEMDPWIEELKTDSSASGRGQK